MIGGNNKTRRSYSQLSSYGTCAKRFQLERRIGIPSCPGWWNAGGTAVHVATANWLNRELRGENA